MALLLAAGTTAASRAAEAAPALTILNTFCSQPDCTDGAEPTGTLLVDNSLDFYATTMLGGAYNHGAVLEIVHGDDGTWHHVNLHDFCPHDGCSKGDRPRGALIRDAKGNLYGTTSDGNVGGNAYELVRRASGKWQFVVLRTFCACTGGARYPQVGLSYVGQVDGERYDGVSTLYGAGRGSIYALDPPAHAGDEWTETPVYAFCSLANCADGDDVETSLYIKDASTIYGMTSGGGAHNHGTVFRLTRAPGQQGWQESVIYSFCALANCADGAEPAGDIALDAAGNIVGVTRQGGTQNNLGTLFSVTPEGEETVLHAFCSDTQCRDGAVPHGGVVIDRHGTIYGTTDVGGRNNAKSGVVFSYGARGYRVLHRFCQEDGCTDGSGVATPAVLDKADRLYGASAGTDAMPLAGFLYRIGR